MSTFSLHGRGGRPAHSRPAFEDLEDRAVPSTTSLTSTLGGAAPSTTSISTAISGYVFGDLNNNGLFDTGEPPIAGNTLQLYRGASATGTPIASAVTDSNGFYQFSANNTISTAPTTKVATATFNSTKTNWTQTAQVAQFDPSLGTLQSIDIVNNSTLQSEFQVENLDNEAGTINSSVTGGVTVTAPGVNPVAATATLSDSFNAQADDGTIDFSGPGGHDSGLESQSGTNSVTDITDPTVLQEFEGSGTVTLSGRATARASVSSPGNVLALINSNAGAQVQVVYHYIPSNALTAGTYTILQTATPQGYLSGLKSSGGVVIPNSQSSNTITVTLQNGSSTNNDFAEIQPSSLSGHVYVDLNNNGVKDPSEPPIPGTSVTLTGTNDLGALAPVVVQTDASGLYQFNNLRPGNYTITETPPSGYNPGQLHVGTLNGVTSGSKGTDQFFVSVSQGQTGLDYDFGEVLPAAPPQVTPPQEPQTPPLSKLLFLSSTLKRFML
jgi:hypothetical protein